MYHEYDTSFTKFKQMEEKQYLSEDVHHDFTEISLLQRSCEAVKSVQWKIHWQKSRRTLFSSCSTLFSSLWTTSCGAPAYVLRFFSRELRICYEVCQYVEKRGWCTWKKTGKLRFVEFPSTKKPLKLAHFQLPKQIWYKYGTLGKLAPSFFKDPKKHQIPPRVRQEKQFLVWDADGDQKNPISSPGTLTATSQV